MQWSLLLVATFLMGTPTTARADGLKYLFFTPDQQARLAYQRKEYQQASDLFIDPLWQGYALFRNGSYEKAAEVLERVETAQADYIRAMSLIRNRQYRDGVRAF